MKNSILKISSTIILFVGLIFQVNAQTVSGSWKGTLEVQGTQIPLVFDVTEEAGVFSSTMDSPSQGATGIPMDETKFSESTITIISSKIGIKYIGTLADNTLIGTFYQSGMELPLSLERSEKVLPGNISLPTSKEDLDKLANWNPENFKYSVEDYFAKPKARSFSFSPNGSYMSYREKDENLKNHVYVKNLETGEVKRIIEEKEELIRGFGWANDNRLVYIMDKGGNEDYHLFAVDIDGNNQKELTPFDGVKVDILEGLKEDKDHMIISMNQNNPQIFEPYKINIDTGELKQLYKNEKIYCLIYYTIYRGFGGCPGFKNKSLYFLSRWDESCFIYSK